MASQKRRENKKLYQRRRKAARRTTVRPDPPRLLLPSKPGPLWREPSFLDQMAVFIAEPEMGLRETDLAGLRVFARALPFESAMRALAALNARVEPTIHYPRQQWSLAQQFFASQPDLLRRYARVLKRAPNRLIFSPQAIALLMRVLIDEARDEDLLELTHTEMQTLQRAVLGAHSALEVSLDSMQLPTSENMLAYELQAGTYFRRALPLEELARHREFLRLATEDPRLRASANRVDILAWLASSGLDMEQQFAVGFGLWAMTHAFDDPIRPRALVEHVDDLLLKLGIDTARELPILASTRSDFRARFDDLGAEDAAFAWELRPFKTTPFLRLSNGDLLLLAPWWLLSWLGEGFHYRAMTYAQRAGKKILHRYTAYVGDVVEQYALDIAETAVPNDVTVLGEQTYTLQSERKTSDVAVVWGTDLFLFEIHSRRVKATAAVTGSALEATNEVSRLIVGKVDQLGRCVEHLLAELARLPGVDISAIERIWPVVVSVGHVLQSPNLWDYIRAAQDREKTQSFNDTRVQPLQLLDIGDYEKLMGLVKTGTDLREVFVLKTGGPFRERDLAVWLHGDKRAPSGKPRHPLLEARWQQMSDLVLDATNMSAGIQPDDDQS